MPTRPFRRLSLAEQTAAHLREKMLAGRWGGKLPGVIRLCAEQGVSQSTMRKAILQLEAEGLLTAGGLGRCRTLVSAPTAEDRGRPLRVGVLLHERMVEENPSMQALLALLQHQIEQAGQIVFLSQPCQASLRHDPERIGSYLAEMQADAWVVVAPRREVLQWFAEQSIPSIAIGGAPDVNVATVSVSGGPARAEAVRRLLDLGHERIVMICLSHLRKPVRGGAVESFTEALSQRGLRWSYAYNVPEWGETPAGFRILLEGLFSVTPPTALLIDETPRAVAALSFLASRGVRVPEQVSIFVGQWDSSLAWSEPPIAHLKADRTPLVRQLVRWLGGVQKGKADRLHTTFPAEFFCGGTLGPVSRG